MAVKTMVGVAGAGPAGAGPSDATMAPMLSPPKASAFPSTALGVDVARYGSAVLLAAAFSAVQVFVVPRRLDVATFGEYRLFLVYVGYLGALHLGLADGAFLRWVGRPAGAIGAEWRRVARWLLALQGAMLGAALIAATRLGPVGATYVVALAAYALCNNALTLAAYAMQAAGDFQWAGRVAVLPPSLFTIAAVALPMRSLGAVLGAYVATTGVAAVVAAAHVRRRPVGDVHDVRDVRPLAARALMRDGLPVLGANLAAGLSQFADRIVVGASVPAARFALYGFASSVMMAASMATLALSRVALSHAAARRADDGTRARFLGGFHDVVAALFGVALLGVPAFERLVARALPAYGPALPIVRALVSGAPFWVALHVVLVGTLQAHGLVRRQLALEATGLALAAAACGACLTAGVPLWGVATAASAAAVATWAIGVETVRRAIGAPGDGTTARFAAAVAWQDAALWLALAVDSRWTVRTVVYATLAAAPTWRAVRAARTRRW